MSQLPPQIPPEQNPYAAPQRPAPPPSTGGDATGGLIPYKNAPALIAYYTSIFSLLCCPLGIVALVSGVMGLQLAARQPEVRGQVHAWIGIVLGAIEVLVSLALVAMAIAGAVVA